MTGALFIVLVAVGCQKPEDTMCQPDCESGFACVDQACRLLCTTTSGCPSGQLCDGQTCAEDLTDNDGDGLSGVEEAVCGSDPTRADTDLDRLNDAEECHIHFSDPTSSDSDGDGITDFDEVFGAPATDPNDADNDKDGEVGVYNQTYGPDCNDRDPLVNSAAGDQWPNGTDLNCAPDAAPNARTCPCAAPCSCYANSWSCTNVHNKGYTVTLTITESYHDAVSGFVPWTYSVSAAGGEQNGECREQITGRTGDYACSTWVNDQGTLGLNYSGFEVVYIPPFRYRLRSVGKENNNSSPYWRLIECDLGD